MLLLTQRCFLAVNAAAANDDDDDDE
eukprot:SAG25_NODE_6800_length_528_cov_2.030303_1_plen_25_part_10